MLIICDAKNHSGDDTIRYAMEMEMENNNILLSFNYCGFISCDKTTQDLNARPFS